MSEHVGSQPLDGRLAELREKNPQFIALLRRGGFSSIEALSKEVNIGPSTISAIANGNTVRTFGQKAEAQAKADEEIVVWNENVLKIAAALKCSPEALFPKEWVDNYLVQLSEEHRFDRNFNPHGAYGLYDSFLAGASQDAVDPERKALLQEQLKVFEDVIQKLSNEKDRITAQQYFLEQKSMEEIATHLKLVPQRVGQLLKRAVIRMYALITGNPDRQYKQYARMLTYDEDDKDNATYKSPQEVRDNFAMLLEVNNTSE